MIEGDKKNMKKYENAEIEVIEIRETDIVTSSGDDSNNEDLGG